MKKGKQLRFGLREGMGCTVPIRLGITDGMYKSSITEENGEFLISFQSDVDDKEEPVQELRIHPADFSEFVKMLNEAERLYDSRKCHFHAGFCNHAFLCSTCDTYKIEMGEK